MEICKHSATFVKWLLITGGKWFLKWKQNCAARCFGNTSVRSEEAESDHGKQRAPTFASYVKEVDHSCSLGHLGKFELQNPKLPLEGLFF